MYQHILVAIDDSPTSRAAFDEALAIARLHGARLTVAHVADETLLNMHHRTLSTTLNLDHARTVMIEAGQSLLAAAGNWAGGYTIQTVLIEARSQRVSEAIRDAARDQGADLVVIGTHGRRGLERLIIGSVAEQLVRIAETSLLLVRKP